MPEPVGNDASGQEPDANSGTNPIPDESTLVGRTGVEGQVLAELARAEGQMSDGCEMDKEDDRGVRL
ncbi:MAG: hypothetical protein JF886_07115 [Candidatus Dormibacteraeota bacterium]|uniref:Uncharacterized protein n=1 Tax=Candidatus Aeolococcus gillhamiae TaxID=3127015 RepID=A0A934N3G5_9BACT|nr:hypothetical protein [Candidatus Dormibacteraeota bacterium]